MPLKYYCPKCNKRYVDWGAEKLDYKCPDCDGKALCRVGAQPESEAAAPSLSKAVPKRKTKAKEKSVVPTDIPLEVGASSGLDDAPAALDDDDNDADNNLEDSLAIDDDD